jgi:hypothetical protein
MKLVDFKKFCAIVLNHSLDGIANLKYKLLCFLTPKKIIFYERGASF